MMDYTKYGRQYFLPPEPCFDWAGRDHIGKAPIWCSVDLRDGNQSLVIPMAERQKLKFFELLVRLGFKEIEVGFPAASETEYRFVRTLIEGGLIPPDVTIQVLTQAREHLMRRTFQAIEGAPRSIVHLYNSTSPVHRQQVFKKSRQDVLRIASDGAQMMRELAGELEQDIRFEYSPENFTATEMDYALEVCDAVTDKLAGDAGNSDYAGNAGNADHAGGAGKTDHAQKVIINLPVTVELSSPHVFAQQVEYMSKHLKRRDQVILSVHPHNDRGCAVADAELGLLAGAERVEGTLFGNGERTGNADIITLAMNLYSQGVDPKLMLSDMDGIIDIYEECTGLPVGERTPYAGQLVFAAFSGSHQDAIAKGMKWRRESGERTWRVPYLPIDPADVGRSSDLGVIRINSQSGKGGVGYILENRYGLHLPRRMKEEIGIKAKKVTDRHNGELTPEEVFDLFKEEYEGLTSPLMVDGVHFESGEDGMILASVRHAWNEGPFKVSRGTGRGALDAVSNTLNESFGFHYVMDTYTVHALEKSSSSRAIAYVGLKWPDGRLTWGAGLHHDTLRASIDALVTAINNH